MSDEINNELGFEEKLDRLEEITELMQSSKIKMQQSVSLFEEGIKLIAELNEELGRAQSKVKILLNGKEEDFGEGDYEQSESL